MCNVTSLQHSFFKNELQNSSEDIKVKNMIQNAGKKIVEKKKKRTHYQQVECNSLIKNNEQHMKPERILSLEQLNDGYIYQDQLVQYDFNCCCCQFK